MPGIYPYRALFLNRALYPAPPPLFLFFAIHFVLNNGILNIVFPKRGNCQRNNQQVRFPSLFLFPGHDHRLHPTTFCSLFIPEKIRYNVKEYILRRCAANE
jgi:hypothetical protein